MVAQWGHRGVRGWDEGWLDLPLEVGDRLGSAVLGAAPGQTVIGDSTTVCFYKLVCAALDARPGRSEIVTDLDNFPTDRYVLEGVAGARGLRLVWLDGDPETVERLTSPISPQTALVTFSHVSYRSARIADMARVNSVVVARARSCCGTSATAPAASLCSMATTPRSRSAAPKNI